MENPTPMNEKTQTPAIEHKLQVAKLNTRKPTAFNVCPSAAQRKAIAARLDLIELRKLRFAGSIQPTGEADWSLTADLGATVVQACVVSLAPVTTRIDIPVSRRFLAGLVWQPDDEDEIEIPTDENSEALRAHIDLVEVMIESLSLALPLYPKVEGASVGETTFTEAGKTPMSDEAARPFAGLSALRDSLKKDQ